MRVYLLICFCLLAGWSRLSAQADATVDRIYTVAGRVYKGHITEDKKGDYVIIGTADSANQIVLYKDILRIQYSVAPDAPEPEAKSPSVLRKHNDEGLVTFNGYHASSHVTDKLIKKRNTGIALTICGIGLVTAGSILAATSHSHQVYNGYGGVTSEPSVGSLAGVVMIIGGVGLTLPGAIIWGSAAGRIRKAQ